MSEDEALKAVVPLARGLIEAAISHHDFGELSGFYICGLCGGMLHKVFHSAEYAQYDKSKPFPHKADCIVKLAEEFIK